MKRDQNLVSKSIHKSLSRVPFLKNIGRDIYQMILSVFGNQEPVITDHELITIENSFFGFHDRTPFSYDDSKLLTHRINTQSSPKPCVSEIEIGYFFGKEFAEFQPITKTNAWNWQQGSLSGWIPNSNTVYVNKVINKRSVACLYQDAKFIKEFDLPFYSICPNGEFAISFDLNRQSSYQSGYGFSVDKPYPLTNSPESGITIVKLNNNSKSKILTIRQVHQYENLSKNDFSRSDLGQAVFSPDGQHIALIHRMKSKRFARDVTKLLIVRKEGGIITSLKTRNIVSHFCWTSNDSILAYCNVEKEDCAFYHFQSIFTSSPTIKLLLEAFDGHPNFHSSSNKVVIDAYPNGRRIQYLKSLDLSLNKSTLLGQFYSPAIFKNSFRVDLHPRWSNTGRFICFDSSYRGSRSTSVLKL